MTFLSQHIIFWHCNMKRSKTSNQKKACKMKNIWLVCKKLQYSIDFYSFSTTLAKFICSFENGSLVSLPENSPYKLFNSESPEYLNEIYLPAEPSNINTWSPFQRLKQSFRKSNKGLNSVSCSSPLLWNKLPIEIKRSGSTNSFKQCKKLLSNKNGTYRFVNIFLISEDDKLSWFLVS